MQGVLLCASSPTWYLISWSVNFPRRQREDRQPGTPPGWAGASRSSRKPVVSVCLQLAYTRLLILPKRAVLTGVSETISPHLPPCGPHLPLATAPV